MAPNWPWFKLNKNGNHKCSRFSSAKGLIRNYCGEWIIKFGMNIGAGSITGAELCVLYQSLCLAWDDGILQLHVDVDNLFVTQLVVNHNFMPNEYASLIKGIKDLLNRNCLVNINHAYKETNFTADFLANSLLVYCIFSIYLLMGLTNGSIIIVLRFYTLVMFCLILGRHVYLP